MNSYFDRLELDSIALEAAIGAFEAENDITDDYLHDYSDYDEEPAYESASTSSDSFGFDIFDDMYAPATEEADGSDTGSKGGKLSQGIKNILASIGKLFTKIKDGIVNFFESFKKKKAQVDADNVKKNAAPEALKLADTMRGAIKQAYSIIANVTVTDTRFIASLCEKIGHVLKANKNNIISSQSGKANYETAGAGIGALSATGKAFREDKSFGDSNENTANAQKALSDAEAILDKVEATRDDLNKAIENVQRIFEKEFVAAWNHMQSKKDVGVKDDKKTLDVDRMRAREAQQREKEEAEEADKKAVDKFNKHAEKRDSVMTNGQAYRVQHAREIPMGTLINQVRQIVFVEYDISELNKAIKAVTDACKNHKNDCDKIMSIVPDNLTGDAKIAYDMCKVLSRSSAVYTSISTAITKLTGGEVFKTKLTDGTKSTSVAGGTIESGSNSKKNGKDNGFNESLMKE